MVAGNMRGERKRHLGAQKLPRTAAMVSSASPVMQGLVAVQGPSAMLGVLLE